MRTMAIACVVMFGSGCSLLFQEHLPSGYAYRSEPRCSTSSGWEVLDFVFSTIDGVIAVGAATAKPPEGEVAALNAIEGALFLISAMTGHSWRNECQHARDEYDRRQSAAQPAADGWFCASSPSAIGASLCSSGRADCERARGVAASAIHDIGSCAPAATVWCFAIGRCAISEASCNAQSAAIGGGVACERR